MKYTFILKENKAGIETVITMLLLALAAIGTVLYPLQAHYVVSFIIAFIFLLASYFVKTIATKFNKIWLLILASVILFVGTYFYIAAVILLCYAVLLKFLQKTPEVIIGNEDIVLKKVFKDEVFLWQ